MMEHRAESKKSRRFLRVAVIVLVALIAGMLMRIRTYDVNTSDAQALLNQNEMYVFAEQNKVAWSQNVWSFAWSVGKRWLLIQTTPAFHRIDCVVYRITSSAVEEHLAKGWPVVGVIAPYKGVPHAFMGQDHNWEVYRWTGTDFVKLASSERIAAMSGHTYVDELFKREGWTQIHVLPVRETADHPLTLGGIPFTMRATQFEDGRSKIELINANEPKSPRVLYEFKNQAGFLSAAAYKNFVE